MHLSDEDIDNLLRNDAQPALKQHVNDCSACWERLEAELALKNRMKRAFSGIQVSVALEERIREQVSAGLATTAGAAVPKHPSRPRPLWRKFLPRAAAAAALITFATLLTVHLSSPASAQAALVSIHEMNIGGMHSGMQGDEFYAQDDPVRLAAYFKERLGFVPAMPRLNQGLSIRGCCVRKFQNQIAGSYVVNTPQGQVSIIVVSDPPEKLGMSSSRPDGSRTIWTGSFSVNNLAAVRVGQYTYCAVGQLQLEKLVQLLSHVV